MVTENASSVGIVRANCRMENEDRELYERLYKKIVTDLFSCWNISLQIETNPLHKCPLFSGLDKLETGLLGNENRKQYQG